MQDEGVESDDLKKDLPLMPPPPDSSSMKLTIREIWFSFAAPTNVRSASQTMSRWDALPQKHPTGSATQTSRMTADARLG